MQKNKIIVKRKVLLLTFTLMLIFSLATITFSWYRNYVEVIGPQITTGQINVNMRTYYVNNFDIKDQKFRTIDSTTIGNITLDSNIETFTPDGNVHMYYFFENPGTTNSIDLDIMLAMNIEGLYTNYEVDKIGGLNITLDNETTDFKDYVMQKYPNNPELSAQHFEAFIKDSNLDHSGGDTRNFLELEKAVISGPVKSNDVLCFRVTVTSNDAITIGHLNKTYPVRMSLCIAQEGGLPGQEKITTYYASTLSSLNAALNLYKPNDKIIITSDIEYVGDLIFNRPINIVIQEASLNIHGNLMFSYSYPGSFSLNTAQSGRVCVYRINNAGGDFEVDLPQASLELIGKNSTLSGQADIYVQRNVKLKANESVGVIFTSSRICETTGVDIYSNTLKDISVGDHTRIEVGSRTEVGNLFSEVDSVIRVRNNGTINTINLQLMSKDTSYVSSPNIFIDNYSVINSILLPEWSSKFVVTINEDTGQDLYSGNTRIISNTGASSMNIQCAGEFKSDGSKNPETDDVEYVRMNQFVEVVNENKSDVIVHYTITEIEELVATGNDNTLKGIMEYYIDNGTINPLNEIKKLKIITYSGSFLTYTNNNDDYYIDDYEYIREKMTSLTELDLSEASSVDYTVPKQAFLNLNNLVHVDMSETDTTWQNNLFQNTGVIEVKMPTSVISIVSGALYNLKYLHTNYTVIDNVVTWGKTKGYYLFTPDQTTFDAYLAKTAVPHQIFIEATRYSGKLGDYFFRVNDVNKTFELATIIANNYDTSLFETSDYMFDFDTITIDGIKYKLTSIGDYAFTSKSFSNAGGDIDLVIGDQVEYIGKCAFQSVSKIKTAKVLGPAIIGEKAFYSITSLTRFEGPEVIGIKTYAFSGCTPLSYFYAPKAVDSENYILQGLKNMKVIVLPMFNDTNINPFGSATLDTLIIYTDENMTLENCPGAFKLDVGHTSVIINEKFKDMWDAKQNPSNNANYVSAIVPIECNTEDIIYAWNEFFPEYIYVKDDQNNLKLLKCLSTNLKLVDNTHIVPSVSRVDGSLIYAKNDPNAFPLVEIAERAYYNITINAETLMFPDSVRKIKPYAFYSLSSNKNYKYLELNQVQEIGNNAFQNSKMITINAPEAHTIGKAAFHTCSSAYFASLPKLKNTTGAIFEKHTNLKYLMLGPCDGVMTGTAGREKLRFILVNTVDATGLAQPSLTTASAPTLVVGNPTTTVTDTIIDAYDNLYFVDFYTDVVEIDGVEYQFEVPSYAYYMKDGKVILGMAIASINDENHTIPSEIYPTGENITFLGKTVQKYSSIKPEDLPEDTPRIIATRVGNYSLKYVTYNADCYLTLGDNFLELGEYACNYITIKGIDVNNVTTLEQSAFNSSKISQFKGDKVQEVKNHVFAYMPSLEVIHLPSVINIGNNAFRGGNNGVLKEVLLGENLTTVTKNAFEENKYLEYIYIFSLNDITGGTFFINCSNLDKTIVYVNESRYDYFQKATFLNGISKSNILTFEKTYTEAATGLSYLLSDLGEGKARMEKVIGLSEDLIGNTLTIPSTFTVIEKVGEEVTYQQDFITTQIGSKFLNSLTGITYITKLTLPDSLEVFDGNGSLLIGSGINEIEISDENTKFATENGVLYSKDMSALIMYPIGKQEVTFTLPSQVKTIYEYAFTCNNYLTNIIIPNRIIILNGAFKNCTSLNSVTFKSTDASMLIGKEMFYSTGSNLVIYVPTGTRDEYLSSIIFDLDIIDIIQENTQE